MKSFKTLVLVKSIAAAVVASAGIAAPAISHASPDDGMACRTGYSGQAVNGTFKCSRVISRVVSLDCPTVTFTLKQRRARVGQSDGRDVCTRPSGLTVAFDSSLAGLTEGQDYVFPKFSEERLASVRKAVEIAEERNLSVADDQVDATSTHGITSGSLVVDASTGADDGVQATITLFTFPIPAANLTLVPIVSPFNPPRLP
jgi:hypothetical protein